MAELSTTTLPVTGADPAPAFVAADVALSDSVIIDGRQIVHIKNGGASPCVVTLDDLGTGAPAGSTAFDPDVEITVPAGEERMIGAISPNRFSRTLTITYDQVDTVTIAVFRADDVL